MFLPPRVEFYDGICRTPPYPLLLEAHSELLAKGWTDPVTMVSWDNLAFVAFNGDTPIAVLSFAFAKWAKQVDVQIGWVDPQHRRRGVYRLLWERLVEKSRELGAVAIFGSTHVDNKTLQAVAARLGRVQAGVLFRFDITA